MRRSVLLLLLGLVAGLGLWFVLAADGDDPAPLGPQANGTTLPAPPTPPPIEQGSVRTPGDTPVVTPPPDPAPTPGTQPTPPPAAPTNVVLKVIDLQARTPVAVFRWQFKNSLGTWRGSGENGRAELGLPDGAFGQLLVEADGLASHVREGVAAPHTPAQLTTLDVFLGPAVPAAGITLHVRDLDLRPVTNVRVDAFALTPESPQHGWHLGTAMWARRTTAADGRYVLPPLAPGSYGIRVVATGPEGELLPLLPFARVFVLTGDNGFVEDVPLQPGCVLVLDLFDASGQPFDPARYGTATLSLRVPGTPAVQRKWLVHQQGVAASAIDVLPGIGKVALAEAIPSGQYSLEVFVNGEPRVSRPLFLRPGLAHTERVDVP